jgi:hypothetical protein
MTAAQLGYTFDVMFDSIANYSSPGFTNQEKSELLNQAQENIYLDVINPQVTPRSSAVLDELNKVILAELINNTGDISPSNPEGLSSELLLSGSGNWYIGTGWTKTGDFTFVHSSTVDHIGPSVNLSGPGIFILSYIISGVTTGSISISYYDTPTGGSTITGITESGSIRALPNSEFNFQIFPTNDFNGTITLSLKKLTTVAFSNIPTGQYIQLPEDFFFPLVEFADIQFLSTSYFYAFTDKYPNHISTNVYVKPIAQLDFTNAFYSHIRKPYEDLVLRMEHGRAVSTLPVSSTNRKIYELFHNDEYVVYKYRASYYRRLVDINIDNNITCELDSFIHRTLVKDAIKLAALAINDKDKYQMASIEKNN